MAFQQTWNRGLTDLPKYVGAIAPPPAPGSYGPTMGCTLGVQNCRDFGLELGSQFQSGALS